MDASYPAVSKRPDSFRRQLQELPAFRALLRAVEADFYQGLAMPRPVLDLGCGDGHFAEVAFSSPLELGLDPWLAPLREARRRRAHDRVARADGAQMPVATGAFGTVVSNSVLEHIPDVEPVLYEVARILRPGGRFYFSVPGPNFRRHLSVARGLDALGLAGLAERYRRVFDHISRHYYYRSPEAWRRSLRDVGLKVERWWPYFSPGALAALEWGHPLGLPSVLAKKLTGRWLLVPSSWNLKLTEVLLRRFYLEAPMSDGAYLFFAVQKSNTAGSVP